MVSIIVSNLIIDYINLIYLVFLKEIYYLRDDLSIVRAEIMSYIKIRLNIWKNLVYDF